MSSRNLIDPASNFTGKANIDEGPDVFPYLTAAFETYSKLFSDRSKSLLKVIQFTSTRGGMAGTDQDHKPAHRKFPSGTRLNLFANHIHSWVSSSEAL